MERQIETATDRRRERDDGGGLGMNETEKQHRVENDFELRSILVSSPQLVSSGLVCPRRISMGQAISPGARSLLALKDPTVISTSSAFRLRKILNNDLPPVTSAPGAIVQSAAATRRNSAGVCVVSIGLAVSLNFPTPAGSSRSRPESARLDRSDAVPRHWPRFRRSRRPEELEIIPGKLLDISRSRF